MLNLFAWFYWDPPRVVFTVPIIDKPIVWYGVLFVIGFFLAYLIMISIFSKFLEKSKTLTQNPSSPHTSQYYVDRLFWVVVLATLIGARLGHVLIYDWAYFSQHPLEIFKVWNGGLASHGATLGVILGLYFFRLSIKKQIPSLTFFRILDLVAIPAGLVAAFIRLGNFANQEILGTPSSLPWAVVFGHPFDGSFPIPRHPVQIYEALCYFFTFIVLMVLWNRKDIRLPAGTYCGILLIFVFSSRFVLEFWKENLDTHQHLFQIFQTGQLLSLPFVLFGFFLIFYGYRKKNLSLKT